MHSKALKWARIAYYVYHGIIGILAGVGITHLCLSTSGHLERKININSDRCTKTCIDAI